MRGFLLVFVLMLGMGACGGQPEGALPVTAAADPGPMAVPKLDAETIAKWSRSCALCHVNGEGGAPRLGYHEEWSERVARGEAQLLQHTVDGYNNMPPLGYCMDCERADFVALIRFMAARPASGS